MYEVRIFTCVHVLIFLVSFLNFCILYHGSHMDGKNLEKWKKKKIQSWNFLTEKLGNSTQNTGKLREFCQFLFLFYKVYLLEFCIY